jgi:copper chaperone CopZ
MSTPQITQFLPKNSDNQTKQVDLSITGMSCSSCVNSIEKSLNKLPGVRATVNLAMESAHIIVPIKMNESELIAAVKQGGNIYLDGAAVSTRLQSPMAIATRRTG